MDTAVRRVNYGMALKYHTVVTGYKFFHKICSSDINLVSNG